MELQLGAHCSPQYQYKPEAQAKVILIPFSIILCESVGVRTWASEANCLLPAEEGWVMEKKKEVIVLGELSRV